MRILNHLSKNLWSEIYKIDNYINNQISKRTLKWLILYKTLFEKKFVLFHLHLYDCRAYFFRQKFFKKNKLKFRTMIDYFVDYDLINIFRIWMFTKTKMITRRNGVGWTQPNLTQTTDGLGLVWVFNWSTQPEIFGLVWVKKRVLLNPTLTIYSIYFWFF